MGWDNNKNKTNLTFIRLRYGCRRVDCHPLVVAVLGLEARLLYSCTAVLFSSLVCSGIDSARARVGKKCDVSRRAVGMLNNRTVCTRVYGIISISHPGDKVTHPLGRISARNSSKPCLKGGTHQRKWWLWKALVEMFSCTRRPSVSILRFVEKNSVRPFEGVCYILSPG